jgi:antitoxin ParD1/3/4
MKRPPIPEKGHPFAASSRHYLSRDVWILKSFVDEQVAGRGYGTSSEYVRELIRADQDRQTLRKLLLDGAASPATAAADETYFSGLRDRIRPAKSR